MCETLHAFRRNFWSVRMTTLPASPIYRPATGGPQRRRVMTSERFETASTRYIHVWLLIGSGVVAAAQVGKAIICIPMIRSDLALGLDFAGLIVATFATLGALMGIGAGVLVGRLGVRPSLIGGMIAIAIGNLIGASASNEFTLLVGRVVEGVGFFGAVLAIPSMLARIVKYHERDFVMAVWSAYMPAGIMLMF